MKLFNNSKISRVVEIFLSIEPLFGVHSLSYGREKRGRVAEKDHDTGNFGVFKQLLLKKRVMNQQTKALAQISNKSKTFVLPRDQLDRLKGGTYPWVNEE